MSVRRIADPLMPHALLPSAGDGSADLASGGPAGPPVPPGALVVTEILLADDLPRGPRLPLFLETVPAGFPSPADDYVEDRLDLHELTGAASPSCFFLRVAGESMVGAGIFDGDIVVVDRALTPVTGSVVVASIDGDLTLKRLVARRGRVMLLAANPDYPAIELSGEQELVVWGVVTHSLRDHRLRAGRPPGPGRPADDAAP